MKYNFIEIGTSDFRTLIQTCDDETKGLSIEPLQYYLNRLPNKKNVTKVNYAISNKEDLIDIYYVSSDNIKKFKLPMWVRGCNSINNPHPSIKKLLKEQHDNVISIQKVKCITWGTLINEFNVSSIDFLKIDTEGHDHIILEEYYNLCINIPSLWANKIIFEMNVLSNMEALSSLITKFKNIGYQGIKHPDDYELIKNKKSL
tara:strand:- start:2291 stop:2896 length:606 start_codon:yes stop_codon:yes gene_type:complete